MIPVYDQNPTSKPAVVTKWLITLNISIHFIRWLGGDAGLRLTESWSFIPAELSQTPAAGLLHAFTALFLHADIFHLITNMIFLHVFGDNIEDILGKRRYLVFYLLSGLGATLTHYWMDPHSTLPLIGASGAIAGILAGYLVVYPRAPVVVINPVFLLWFIFGPLLLLPAWLVIGLFFITNISSSLMVLGGAISQTAFLAHVGGFLTGLLLIRPMIHGKAIHPAMVWTTWKAPKARRRPIFPKNSKKPFWKDS